MPSIQYFLYLGEQKKVTRYDEQGGCSSTVICLLAKNSLTDSAVFEGALSWCKLHWVVGKKLVSFPSNFSTPINNNTVMKRWYANVIKPYWGSCQLLPRQAHSGEFANFIVRPRVQAYSNYEDHLRAYCRKLRGQFSEIFWWQENMSKKVSISFLQSHLQHYVL
jgi:hypothetical protein